MNGEAVIDNARTVAMAPFLTAVWSHLVMVTFAVPDEALAPYLPPGTEPDRWEGSALASVVAFDFKDTRVRGLSMPGFRTFPEWNLRIYLRYGEARGVSFVREFVPNPVVAAVARTVYNEPYSVARFESHREQQGPLFSITHRMRAAGRWHTAGVLAHSFPQPPPEEGIVPFVKEQAWGFGRTRSGRLLRYRVEHAPWRVFRVDSWNLDVDFRRLYGPNWAFLQDQPPLSVILAEGSTVTVYPREVVE